jgi:hypothetical protein
MTSIVDVVVERSPGGLRGWHCQVGGLRKQLWGLPFKAMGWTRLALVAAGADKGERKRVLCLIFRELEVRRRAIVAAEVRS